MIYVYETMIGRPPMFSGRMGGASSIEECKQIAEDAWAALPGGVSPAEVYFYDRGRWRAWTYIPTVPRTLVYQPLDPAYPPAGPVFPA